MNAITEINRHFDEAMRSSCHADALADNAKFDIDRAAQLARCTETAKAMLTQGRSLVLPESYCERDALIDAGLDDFELSDEQIEEFGVEWGLDKPALVTRLRKYVADADALSVAA